MEFFVKSGLPDKQRTACLVLPVFESETRTPKLPSATKKIDDLCGGLISQLVKKGDHKGELGQTLVLHQPPKCSSERILLVGCGKANDFKETQFIKAVQGILSTLLTTGATDCICFLTELTVGERALPWKIEQAIVTIKSQLYKFEDFKSKPTPKAKAPKLKSLTWMTANRKQLKEAELAIDIAEAIATGISFTKDLANTPGNVCTPSYLAKQATALAKKYKSIQAAILDQKDMQALKMGSLLSVAQGSAQPPKLITLEYQGASSRKTAPIVLVGKGITFDTGGNSLKPPGSMIGMKYDMCGAATVMGMMKVVATLKLPINVIGVIAAAENMPGSKASRPDDIVTSMSGKTIEILNTDAEGRLVLCDALTYCERYKPDVIIDMATLTGACVVALGRHHSAVYANQDELAQALVTAGQSSLDKCWHMPLGAEYRAQLDSNFADIANIGGPEAGSITAACFLAEFTEKYNWAHLDIAGTACRFTGKEKSASGRPVHMLSHYILQRCHYKG